MLQGKVIASATSGVVHMAATSIASDTGNMADTVSQEKVCICVCVRACLCACMHTVQINQQQLCTRSIQSHTLFVLF